MTLFAIISLITALFLGIVFFILFVWAVNNGQFEDTEEAKYEIFRKQKEPKKGRVRSKRNSR